jgi:hypothetical protein
MPKIVDLAFAVTSERSMPLQPSKFLGKLSPSRMKRNGSRLMIRGIVREDIAASSADLLG